MKKKKLLLLAKVQLGQCFDQFTWEGAIYWQQKVLVNILLLTFTYQPKRDNLNSTLHKIVNELPN